MDVVYLFDVDGTLTPPRQRIDEEFGEIFLGWVREQTKTAYLVTGSDVSKTKEQLFDAFIDQCAGVFTCSGNVFYLNNEIVYKNEIEELGSRITFDVETDYKMNQVHDYSRVNSLIPEWSNRTKISLRSFMDDYRNQYSIDQIKNSTTLGFKGASP